MTDPLHPTGALRPLPRPEAAPPPSATSADAAARAAAAPGAVRAPPPAQAAEVAFDATPPRLLEGQRKRPLLGADNMLAVFGASGERVVSLPPVGGGKPQQTWLAAGTRRLEQLEGVPAVVTEGSRAGHARDGIRALADHRGVIRNLADRDEPAAFAVVPEVYTAIDDRHHALTLVDDHFIEVRPRHPPVAGQVLANDAVRLVPPGSIVTIGDSRFKVVAHGSTDASGGRGHCLIVQSIAGGGGRDLKVASGAALAGAKVTWVPDAPVFSNGPPLGPAPRR